jgi:uncharacterized membrane protein
MRLFHRQINSRELSFIAAFSAIGAVTRILLGNLALESPIPIYGVLIKIGLTETLTFISGFVFGSVAGFMTGALIIVTSDLYVVPGPWTPFIAAIIGLFGVGAGIIRRYVNDPGTVGLGLCAAALTILSEFLQNTWVALFYNVPIVATMISGLPSLAAALVNNVILIGTTGPRVIRLVQRATERASSAS